MFSVINKKRIEKGVNLLEVFQKFDTEKIGREMAGRSDYLRLTTWLVGRPRERDSV